MSRIQGEGSEYWACMYVEPQVENVNISVFWGIRPRKLIKVKDVSIVI